MQIHNQNKNFSFIKFSTTIQQIWKNQRQNHKQDSMLREQSNDTSSI